MICEEVCDDKNAIQTNRTVNVKENCAEQLRELMKGEFIRLFSE
jgi:hypothetical protein